MKKRRYIISLGTTIILFFLCLICCSSNSNSNNDPDLPGSQTQIVKITPITDLNKGSAIIDSHKDEKNSVLELDFRRTTELSSELSTKSPHYPRVKKISEERYILFYQDAQVASNIYFALSKDLMSWGTSQRLFSAYPHGSDERRFSTCDAVVLQNEDILAVCSFRDNKGYSTRPWDSGLMLRRSSDKGVTWSEEEVIYIGSNWEPYLLQLPDGEIQIYFTDNDPTAGIHNSGSSIIRSYDNGKTWIPSKGEHPIRVIHQYTYTNDNGVKIFSGQMASARLLHDNKTIAVVCEARLNYAATEYRISSCYSDDNWQESIGEEVDGPLDHNWNMFRGAGPYLSLFPSGESILSYSARVANNIKDSFILLIGDNSARNFDNSKPNYPFPQASGFWGFSELEDPHTLIVGFPNIITKDVKATLFLGQMMLNHRINTPQKTVIIDGDNKDWIDNTDAFFLGSDSRSQASFRFAHDSDNIYMLIERFDDFLTNDDQFTLMLNDNTKTIKLKLKYDSTTKMLIADNDKIICKSAIDGVFNDNSRDNGIVTELLIPISLLNLDMKRLMFNAILHDKNINDGFNNLKEDAPENWLPVVFN